MQRGARRVEADAQAGGVDRGGPGVRRAAERVGAGLGGLESVGGLARPAGVRQLGDLAGRRDHLHRHRLGDGLADLADKHGERGGLAGLRPQQPIRWPALARRAETCRIRLRLREGRRVADALRGELRDRLETGMRQPLGEQGRRQLIDPGGLVAPLQRERAADVAQACAAGQVVVGERRHPAERIADRAALELDGAGILRRVRAAGELDRGQRRIVGGGVDDSAVGKADAHAAGGLVADRDAREPACRERAVAEVHRAGDRAPRAVVAGDERGRPTAALGAAVFEPDRDRPRRGAERAQVKGEGVAAVVGRDAVAHDAVEQLLRLVVRLEIDPGLRCRAPRVGQRAVLDQQVARADDADALPVVVREDHVADHHLGARHAAPGDAQIDAVPSAVGQCQARHLHARAALEAEHVPPLRVRVLRLVVIVALPHPQRRAAAGQRDVRLQRRREEAVARAVERAALGLHHDAGLEDDFLVARKLELVHDPRRAQVFDEQLARAGPDRGLQRRGRVRRIEAPPRRVRLAALARGDLRQCRLVRRELIGPVDRCE